MAKKLKSGAEKVPWKGYVSCELNAERKKQFREQAPHPEEFEMNILECLSPGYKLSFSVDTYHDCIQVSWFCGATGDPNAGWCLTARGATVQACFAVLMFKHYVILEGDWSSAPPLDEGDDQIG